jgi:fatty acid desaturase
MSIGIANEFELNPSRPEEGVVSRAYPRAEFLDWGRRLSDIQSVRPPADILSQWLLIAAVVALAAHVDSWPVWAVAVIVIATRQHALLVLMHEAAHCHLFKSRVLNDWVSDLFCAFPMNITTTGYRHGHMQHHSGTNTPRDPYWVIADEDPATWAFPRSRLGALRVYLFDVLGIHAPRHLKIIWPWTYAARLLGLAKPRVSLGEHVRYLAWMAALATTLTLTDTWLYYALLWLAPSITLMMANFRIRALAEHPYTPASGDEILEARQVDGTSVERFFFAPLNINYHLAHHVYPSIPYYNLPAMHALLQRHGYYELGRNYFPRYVSGRHSVLAHLTSGSAPAAPPRV